MLFLVFGVFAVDYPRSSTDLTALKRHSPPPIMVKEPTTRTSYLPLSAIKSISRRKLFGELLAPGARSVKKNQPKNIKSKGTELILIGIFLGESPKSSFAIIENGRTHLQEAVSIDDEIFDEAILVDIKPNTVSINRDDKIEELTLEEGSQGSKGGESPPDGNSEVVELAESDISEALDNLPVLLTQARTVPYFSNGKRDGLRMFAIRTGSFFDKIGLKNGDILKSINSNDLNDPANALQLFEKLKNEKTLTVKLVRNQKEKVIVYRVK